MNEWESVMPTKQSFDETSPEFRKMIRKKPKQIDEVKEELLLAIGTIIAGRNYNGVVYPALQILACEFLLSSKSLGEMIILTKTGIVDKMSTAAFDAAREILENGMKEIRESN